MQGMGTKRMRMKDAVLANANAKQQKEVDPDSGMSAG